MISGLSGIIPGGITSQDLSAILNISEFHSQNVLDEFVSHDIGTKKDDAYFFDIHDKLKAAIWMIQNGCPIDDISTKLHWKDFEGLVSEILYEKNFAVMKNLILTKPRMEIDVVGIRLGIAMLIDCKHWKRYPYSSLMKAVNKQVERTKSYVSKTQNSVAVPVIVTLYKDKVDFIDKVPIVPIFQFASFVDDFYGNLEQMKTIETN
ncbi:MAG: hypothetical protein KC483_04515 [Nitrosarchaeum sp.]|nr:hypothetical protein [Nitrosarchaeum sp.]